jgi:16S rRNA (uracil1498-N3)-methyltransferase
MPDFRVHWTSGGADPRDIVLSPEESHHLVSVNRARVGDPVVAFDGQGTEWRCELIEARKSAAVLRVQGTRRHERPGFSVTLGQALPKGSAMDGIIRKATEIGAVRIVPLESERTQVHLESDRSERKVEKWRTAALEAAKQCGNPFLPEILPVQRAVEFAREAQGFDLKLVASLHPGAQSLKRELAAFRNAQGRNPRTVLWLVGPEGDFSPAEMAAIVAADCRPITLGPLVLRCETAATYALSVLSYELQEA